MSVPMLKNYIDGVWVESTGRETAEVRNPATGEVIARVPLSSPEDAERAAQAARRAFEVWRRTPPLKRARTLMKLKDLILANRDEIAAVLTTEHGKIRNEALMELARAVENIEVACGAPSMMMGHNLEDVAEGIDEYAVRQPVGVFASLNRTEAALDCLDLAYAQLGFGLLAHISDPQLDSLRGSERFHAILRAARVGTTVADASSIRPQQGSLPQ